MNIKIIGEGCDKCNKLYENAKEAIAELGINAELEKVENLLEIVKLGVMTAPSMMVDGKLLVSGKVAKKEEIIKILKKL